MSPEAWAAVVGVAIASCALSLTAWQAVLARRSAQLQALESVLSIWDSLDAPRQWLREQDGPTSLGWRELPSEGRELSFYFDRLGLYVFEGVVPLASIGSMIGSSAVRAWEVLAPAIRSERHEFGTNPRYQGAWHAGTEIQAHFEWLVMSFQVDRPLSYLSAVRKKKELLRSRHPDMAWVGESPRQAGTSGLR